MTGLYVGLVLVVAAGFAGTVWLRSAGDQAWAVRQVATCGAMAALCICVKQAGHEAAGDEVHSCDPAVCTGKWTGDYDQARLDGGRNWRPVIIPSPVRS